MYCGLPEVIYVLGLQNLMYQKMWHVKIVDRCRHKIRVKLFHMGWSWKSGMHDENSPRERLLCAFAVAPQRSRCLDSLYHSWHTTNRQTLRINGPKSVLISVKVAAEGLRFNFGEYLVVQTRISYSADRGFVKILAETSAMCL